MSKQLKATILGMVAVAGIVAFALFAWGESVSRNADAAIAEIKQSTNSPGSGATDVPMPDLKRPVIVTAAITPEAAKENLARITEITASINGDSDIAEWLKLGMYRKAIGDWDGAEEIWEYVAATRPTDGISLANLANLYIYDRKKFKEGEGYLLRAIERAPYQVFYYETAYELYHFILKDDAKGKEVIRKGLLANPEEKAAFNDILARF